jgi:cytochrome c biogenesis factor
VTVVAELALWTALFLAAWAAGASFVGAAARRPELAESGVRAIVASTVMIALACAGLWAALLGHDFSLEYVGAHTTLNAPTLYLATAFWGGPQGALLWWGLALAACSAIELRSRGRRHDVAAPSVAGALGTALTLTLVALCFVWNPFDRVEWVPGDGRGLASALQNPWAPAHLFAIYPAYALAAVAVVVAAAAMVRRGSDTAWRGALRRWSLGAWCLLTAAVGLGMRWAYTEPALGGSWSWDGPTSANMVLWLVGAGLVRSLLVRDPRATPSAPRRRAFGMYVVYLGVALLLVGLAARRHWKDELIRLQPGQSADLRDPYREQWRLVSQGASRDEGINFLSTGVAVEAWRGATSVGVIAAERRQYLDGAQRPVSEPAAKPGIRSLVALDVYLLLTEVRGELAELRVSFRPLVVCVWIGWVLVLAGALTVAIQLASRARARAAALAASST